MSDTLGNKGKIYYSTDGTTYTEFAGVLSIKPGKPTRGKIPNTALDSTKKTNLAGLPEYGSLELEIKYKTALTATIMGWFAAATGTDMYFKVTLNDAITPSTGTPSTGIYVGFVEAFDPFGEIKVDELVKNALTISINDFTFTAAT